MFDMNKDHVTRIEDLPYYFSPPVQFTFTQQASLTLGQYVWTTDKVEVANNKNITDNTMLYIKAFSFSADIVRQDYQQALQLNTGDTDIPRFSLFSTSDANAAVLVDPIQLGDYFNDQEYKKLFLFKQDPVILSGSFEGKLEQTGALAGVAQINLTMNIWVQAITDDNFIAAIKERYPKVTRI